MFPQGRFWVDLVVGNSEWAIYLADLVMGLGTIPDRDESV